jgi:acyl-CoA synthetase (AMP-forming)/AMP-acid ligase II
MWRQSDTYVVSMNGADHESATEIHEKVRNAGPPWFAVSPLMHAAGMWTAFAAILGGQTVVLYDGSRFDPRVVLETAEREKVGMMTIVGDAYTAPLVGELRRVPTTCRPCSHSRPVEPRPIRNTNGRCWKCCRRSR